jgi:hypothetical protein
MVKEYSPKIILDSIFGVGFQSNTPKNPITFWLNWMFWLASFYEGSSGLWSYGSWIYD